MTALPVLLQPEKFFVLAFPTTLTLFAKEAIEHAGDHHYVRLEPDAVHPDPGYLTIYKSACAHCYFFSSRLRYLVTFITASVLRILNVYLPGCRVGPGQPKPNPWLTQSWVSLSQVTG